jgi:hypothetical protein
VLAVPSVTESGLETQTNTSCTHRGPGRKVGA